MFNDDDSIIDVCLFEDLPFSQDYTVLSQWRSGDIIDILISEGHIKNEERNFTKVVSVTLNRYYTMDIKTIDEIPKPILIDDYNVGVSKYFKDRILGVSYTIQNMDAKIRDIKIKNLGI
jgi:hypothetical protein